MAKTWQVMTLESQGFRYICICDFTAKLNQYKLYKKWYDHGWHKQKIAEYADLQSILWHLLQTEFRVYA